MTAMIPAIKKNVAPTTSAAFRSVETLIVRLPGATIGGGGTMIACRQAGQLIWELT